MTCIIESISCQIRKKPQCAKPKRESDGRRAAKTPPLEPTAPAARADASALAPRPFNPAPLCSLSLCSDSYLYRTRRARDAAGDNRRREDPKVRDGSLNVGPREDEKLWKTS